MTDHEKMVQMLADANMRYSIVVHNGGSTILVNGSRAETPFGASQVTMEFDATGRLTDVFGRD